MNKIIRTKYKNAKEEWLQKKCEEIAQSQRTDPKDVYKKVKHLVGSRTSSTSGCIRARGHCYHREGEDSRKTVTMH